MSMAAVLLAAGEPGKRLVLPHTKVRAGLHLGRYRALSMMRYLSALCTKCDTTPLTSRQCDTRTLPGTWYRSCCGMGDGLVCVCWLPSRSEEHREALVDPVI